MFSCKFIFLFLANWDKCQEIRKCEQGDVPYEESPWEVDCYDTKANAWYNEQTGTTDYFTTIEYPLFEMSDRFMTNSAVWIVMNDGAEFDLEDINLENACSPGQTSHCWNIKRHGLREYQFIRGHVNNQHLDRAGLSWIASYTTDPMSVVAERMFLCDADVQELPSDAVTETVPVSTTPMTTSATTRSVHSGTRPNLAHSRLDLTRNNWEEMISKSVMSRWPMSSRRADLTRRKFNRICDRVKTRHDKMTEAGCYFESADEIIFDAVLINFKDTCETTSKLIQGNLTIF